MKRMRLARLLFAPSLFFGISSFSYALNPNVPGAFLVFPNVVVENSGGVLVETFLTITNTSLAPVTAHVAFVNGDSTVPQYCYECDFDIPLAGLDTDTVAFSRNGATTTILNIDTGVSRVCSQRFGFVTVNIEDAQHNVLTDNVLIGDEVVLNYTAGTSESLAAIALQGLVGNGDRNFRFDGVEFEKLPLYVMGDFLAPDFSGPVDADLILLTLGFQYRFPPYVDCAITGVDAFARAITTGVDFGCWTRVALESIDPELAYPYLGVAFGGQEHGWLKLRCTTNGTGQTTVAAGGVIGLLVQKAASGAVLRRASAGPAVSSAVAWDRLLHFSPITGDSVVLTLASAFGPSELRPPLLRRAGATVNADE